jgi:hypothetical protein
MQGFIPPLFETLILIVWQTYLKGQEKLYLNFDTISPPFEVMPNDYT